MTSVVLDTNIYDKIVERGMTDDLERLIVAGSVADPDDARPAGRTGGDP
jgi:hypothetical protein